MTVIGIATIEETTEARGASAIVKGGGVETVRGKHLHFLKGEIFSREWSRADARCAHFRRRTGRRDSYYDDRDDYDYSSSRYRHRSRERDDDRYISRRDRRDSDYYDGSRRDRRDIDARRSRSPRRGRGGGNRRTR